VCVCMYVCACAHVSVFLSKDFFFISAVYWERQRDKGKKN
jgi:hypothetical protein